MVIDNFIVFFSYLLLTVAFGFSIKEFASSSTVFEEMRVKDNTKLPEFTICPKTKNRIFNNSIESFEEILSILQDKPHRGINAWMGTDPTPSANQDGLHKLSQEMLHEKYNATFEEVWKFVPRIRNEEPFDVEICFILTLPIEKPIENILNVQITLKGEFFEEHLVMMHEKGGSVYNHDVDPTEYELFGATTKVGTGNKYRIIIGQQIVTQSLKTSTRNCHEDNLNIQSDCINNVYSKILGCNLPWSKVFDESKRLCNGSKKFNEFRKLSMSIHETSMNEKLIKEGCIVPNCNQRKFVRTAESLGRRKPVFRKEIKQYSFTHLFADFCGYVGLFLGESLISYFLQAIHWIRREFGKKEKEIKLEPREELQNDFVRNLFIRRNQDKMKTPAIKNVKKT